MKRHVFALSAAASLAIFSSSATAAVQPTNAQLIAQIQKISQETSELRGEVRSLKSQLRHRNKGQKSQTRRHRKSHRHYPRVTQVSTETVVAAPAEYHPMVTVTTSPWLGMRSHFRPLDILEHQGTMNEDLYLLQQKQKFLNGLAAAGLTLDRPIVQISGGVEGQAIQDLQSGNGSINLSTVEFDVNAVASTWASAFFTFDYDSSPAMTGSRDPNSRIYLQRGFLTIGNLERSPIYFSIGQMYAPFGIYDNWMLTTPINESIMRILTRTAVLGFSSHGFYGQAYAFTGDRITNQTNLINQGGFNLGVDHTFGRADIDLGYGMVSNIAESQGMQNNGLATFGFFNGFGVPTQLNGVVVTNLDNLRKNVGGADAHAELSFKPFTLIGEYQWATNRFNPLDMTYNNVAALPSTLHTEVDFDFQISWVKLKLIGVYDESWQAYALNVPRQSYAVGLLTSLWKDTMEGIEFRHNQAYNRGVVATGGTINGVPVPFPVSNGRPGNMITGQIGVYF